MANNRKSLSVIELSEEQKERIKEEIASLYLDIEDEEIGVIKQEEILEFFMEHMAPIIYNKALDDVKNWHRMQLDNMESDYYMLYRG